MKAYERGYLWVRAEISADKDGDICGQKRRYLPAKPHKGLTDKVHIDGYLLLIIPLSLRRICQKHIGNDASAAGSGTNPIQPDSIFLHKIRTVPISFLYICSR